MGILEEIGLVPERTEVSEELRAKCQDNEWVRDYGIPWQEDPYLEEYPYDFCHAPNMESLAGFFERGNWSIRQGVTYRDLAFVQQVDGGDEWWGLKHDESGWHDFESANLGRLVSQSRQDFERTIASMSAATTEECIRLEYKLPYGAAGKAAETLTVCDARGAETTPENLKKMTAAAIAASPRSTDRIVDELSEGGASARSLLSHVRSEIAKSKSETLEAKAEACRFASQGLSDMRPQMRAMATQPR